MKTELNEQIGDTQFPAPGGNVNYRSESLAARLEAGATALAVFAAAWLPISTKPRRKTRSGRHSPGDRSRWLTQTSTMTPAMKRTPIT